MLLDQAEQRVDFCDPEKGSMNECVSIIAGCRDGVARRVFNADTDRNK
jgi:hypothetical protein